MTHSNAPGRPGGPLDPQALSLGDLARVLAAAGARAITLEMLRADLAAGAPQNADGTVNLVHYIAWLLKERTRAS